MGRRDDNCGSDLSEFRVEKLDDADEADSVLVEALARLESALNALPDPLGSVAAELTPADVAALMRPMPNPARTGMLQHLGFGKLTVRQVPQSLCRDIVTRIRPAREHEQWHAVMTLTTPVRSAEVTAAALASLGADPQEITKVTRLERWPDRMLRAGIWSQVYASRAGARVLVWAGEQSWWLPASCSEEHVRDVLDAARAVIDASPDFPMPGLDEDDDMFGVSAQAVSAAARAARSAAGPSEPADDAQQQEPHTDAAMEGQVEMLDEPSTTDLVTDASVPGLVGEPLVQEWPPRWLDPKGDAAAVLSWAVPAREQACREQRQAEPAAAEILAAVQGGRLPDPASAAALASYERYLSALLTQAGEHSDLGAFDAAIAELAAADSPRARLARLAARPDAQVQVQAAVTRVHDLLAAGPGGSDDALAALAELVEYVNTHGSSADAMKLVGMQQRSFQLPADLLPLVGAASVGQLLFEDLEPGERSTAELATDYAGVHATDDATEPSAEPAGEPAAVDAVAAGEDAAAVEDDTPEPAAEPVPESESESSLAPEPVQERDPDPDPADPATAPRRRKSLTPPRRRWPQSWCRCPRPLSKRRRPTSSRQVTSVWPRSSPTTPHPTRTCLQRCASPPWPARSAATPARRRLASGPCSPTRRTSVAASRRCCWPLPRS